MMFNLCRFEQQFYIKVSGEFGLLSPCRGRDYVGKLKFGGKNGGTSQLASSTNISTNMNFDIHTKLQYFTPLLESYSELYSYFLP